MWWRMVILLLSEVAALATGALLARDPVWEPLVTPPVGWTWVALPSEDSIRGVYHDSVSGAFVEVDIGRRTRVGSWRETARHDASVHHSRGVTESGIPYDLVTAEDARGVVARSEGRMTGDTAGDTDDPNVPVGCSLIAVTFPEANAPLGEGPVSNFWSATCNNSQKERARQLLLGRSSLRPPMQQPIEQGPAKPRRRLNLLEKGLALREVLKQNGWPYECRRNATDGIILLMPLPLGAADRMTELTFDRGQHLLTAREVTELPGRP